MFENKMYHVVINNVEFDVHASRLIASWNNETDRGYGLFFKKWLAWLGLNDSQVNEVYQLAVNGKMEVESSVNEFLTTH